MSKKIDKPTRLITFGEYMWCHWIIISFDIIAGLLLMILPSALMNKVIIRTIIVGAIFVCIGILFICFEIRYKIKLKKWKEKNKV